MVVPLALDCDLRHVLCQPCYTRQHQHSGGAGMRCPLCRANVRTTPVRSSLNTTIASIVQQEAPERFADWQLQQDQTLQTPIPAPVTAPPAVAMRGAAFFAAFGVPVIPGLPIAWIFPGDPLVAGAWAPGPGGAGAAFPGGVGAAFRAAFGAPVPGGWGPAEGVLEAVDVEYV
jgi:hypothetical protein